MSHYNTVYSIIHKRLVEPHSGYEIEGYKADGGPGKAAHKLNWKRSIKTTLVESHDR
jgi:hypothetical protein